MKRKISGVLLLDKPFGITSNAALQLVKNLFAANKAGHTGSLDPTATGMLPICFGEATKFSQFLLEADKRYLVTGKLGEITASGDSESEVTKVREVKGVTAKTIEQLLPQFRGRIWQLPPMYSAIKHHGRPLYELARQGIEVDRTKREINIHQLKLLDFTDNLAKFELYCSKGTYVRTLIVDLGEAIGCGAHVINLRRLAVGPYSAEEMLTLDQLQALANNNDAYQKLDQTLLPIESMLVKLPELALAVDLLHYLFLGQSLFMSTSLEPGLIKLKGKDGRFFGVGEILTDGKIVPRKMLRV